MPEEPAMGGGGGGGGKPPKATDDLGTRVKELEQALAGEVEQRLLLQKQEFDALQAKLTVERVERARQQARVQFPQADQELLTEYPSQDPDAILAYAAKLHEKAQLRIYDMNGVPLPATNQSDAALSAEQSQIRRWQTQVRHQHLRKQLDPIEAEQAFETFFRIGWNTHMDERKRRAGMAIAPLPNPNQ